LPAGPGSPDEAKPSTDSPSSSRASSPTDTSAARRSSAERTTPPLPIDMYRDFFGNWCSRILAPAGLTTLTADALVNGRAVAPEQPSPVEPAAFAPDVTLPTRPQISVLGPLTITGAKRSRRGLRTRALELWERYGYTRDVNRLRTLIMQGTTGEKA